MKKVIVVGVFSVLVAGEASADWLEVFHMQLKDGCTAPQLQTIGDKLTKKFGKGVYTVEIVTNQHGANENSVLWIGRSPNAAAWGKANDTWVSEVASGGESANLNAEIFACVSTAESGTWRTVR